MKVPLLKTSFIGPKSELKKLIELLKSTGEFEMTFFKRAQGEIADSEQENYDRLSALHADIKNAINFAERTQSELKIKESAWRKKTTIEYDSLKSFAEYEADAMQIVKDMEETAERVNQIKATIAQNEETIRQLKPYLSLPIAFDMLSPTQSAFITCGIMPNRGYERYLRDFGSGKISTEAFSSGKDKKCVVITCHREDAAIADIIYDFGFEPCKFDFSQNAVDATANLAEQIEELKKEYTLSLQIVAALGSDDIQTVKNFYDYVSNELDTAELAAKTVQTEKYYMLNGWIVSDRENEIRRRVGAMGKDVVMKFEQATDADEPPVFVKNNKLVKPFGQVTDMYGAPGRTDIDPNPWVAFFYFIFFGMMVGDIGYGLLLSVACIIFIYWKKPFGNTKQLMLLFGIGGVSAVIWGFFYGTAFGFGVPSRLIDPIDDAIYLLLISLAMGLVQMFVGICLNFYKHCLNKKYWNAFLDDLPRIVLFIGLFMFLPKAAFGLFNLNINAPFLDMISMPGLYVALVGIVGIILFNGRKKKGFFGKIAGAFSGAYGLINYFNDVISYVRLFALALVSAVLAYVANTLGDMLFALPVVGYPVGILVAVIFHVFNLGLGLMSAYVHGARLHFIEFFSKFYSGEGTAFKPIGSNLRYTYIKGGK